MGADDNIEQLSNLSREALENFSKEQFIDLVLVLVEQNRQLQARVQELERRLNTYSTNSSNPPTSDPPGTEKKKSPKKKKRKRQRGRQKGHEGHQRALVPGLSPSCPISADLVILPSDGLRNCSRISSELT